MSTVLGFDFIAFWIVVTGALVGVSGATLGSFLVLRRMSLLGDAISHAILPGIGAAFFLSGSRDALPMLLGALAAGLATVAMIKLLQDYGRIPEDAATGVVFTSMFALGVIMLSKAAHQVDLDPGCVLYGMLETVPLDETVNVLGFEVPRVTATIGVVAAVVIGFVVAFWKELRLLSFDPNMALTVGYSVKWVHHGFLVLVALVTVTSFEAVGSILIVAMFIGPPVAASLLTRRLEKMVPLAAGLGALSALLGRWTGSMLETSAAAMMGVTAGGFVFLAVMLAPREGFLPRQWADIKTWWRIVEEDILGALYRRQERGESYWTAQEIRGAMAHPLLAAAGILTLERSGYLMRAGGRLRLTQSGSSRGGKLVRSHRLWESFLARNTELPLDHLHEPADRIEHHLPPELLRKIEEDAQHTPRDPHGRPIPKEE